MKVRLFVFLLSILSVTCNDQNDHGIITWKLKRSDFAEKISVQGTVQAVVNTPVMPPRNQMGLMTVVRLVQNGAYVKKGDTLCVLSSPEVEAKYREMLTTIENLEAELKKAEADSRLNIALLEAQLATSEAQLKISSLDSLKMKYTTPVQRELLDLQMKKAEIERKKTEKKLAATRIIGVKDIQQKKASIAQEKMRAQSFADQISAMTIIAQRDGMVTRTESPRIMVMSTTGTGTFGGPVREGSVIILSSPVLQFPDLSRMQISADVAEADFKKIEKGQKVILTVEAAEKLITTGKVNRKSLATSIAQRYSDSKVRSYEVIIDVDSCHSRMKPGLSTNCEIILREVKDTLFVPVLAIFEKDSSNVVYVKVRNKFMPVEVETGLSGSSYTIITGGLKGGEEIALTEPPGSLVAMRNNKSSKDRNRN